MVFLVNTSPLSGKEGKKFTRVTLQQRLQQECDNNISLKFECVQDIADAFKVSGRGEMQLGILIETIRREGFEISVSPPQVLLRETDGMNFEPIEEVTIDCDAEYTGIVIEKLSKRKSELTKSCETNDGKSRLIFKCPTRGLIGYASELKNDTKGTGILNHSFLGYEPHKGELESSRKGCMISMTDGLTTGYSLKDLESRGQLFVGPGTAVYSGMVIGECSRSLDMDVNPCRAKVLTNIRSTVKDEFVRLSPPKAMPLEELIAYMAGKKDLLRMTLFRGRNARCHARIN